MTDWNADILFWGAVALLSVIALALFVEGVRLVFGATGVGWRMLGGVMSIAGIAIGVLEIVAALIAQHMAHM